MPGTETMIGEPDSRTLRFAEREGAVESSAPAAVGRERRREVLEAVLAGRLSRRAAAQALGLTVRHVRRLIERFKGEGERALVHGLKGRPSNRRIRADIQARALELLQGAGLVSPAAAARWLREQGIEVSRETVRKWLRDAGLRSRPAAARPGDPPRPLALAPRPPERPHGDAWLAAEPGGPRRIVVLPGPAPRVVASGPVRPVAPGVAVRGGR